MIMLALVAVYLTLYFFQRGIKRAMQIIRTFLCSEQKPFSTHSDLCHLTIIRISSRLCVSQFYAYIVNFLKVSFQLGAPFNKSGELDFIPLASHFAGDQGSSLTFATADNNEIVVLLFTQGVMSASWGTSAGTTMAGAQCTTQDLKIDASSASGSFDCAHGVAISGGAQTMDASLKGSFTAHN